MLVVADPYTSHSSALIANSHIPYRTTLPPDNPTTTERVPHDPRIRHTTHTFPTQGLVHRDTIRTTHRLKVYRQRVHLLYQQGKLQFPIYAPYTYIWYLGHMSTHHATSTAYILHSQYCNHSMSPRVLPLTHMLHHQHDTLWTPMTHSQHVALATKLPFHVRETYLVPMGDGKYIPTKKHPVGKNFT